MRASRVSNERSLVSVFTRDLMIAWKGAGAAESAGSYQRGDRGIAGNIHACARLRRECSPATGRAHGSSGTTNHKPRDDGTGLVISVPPGPCRATRGALAAPAISAISAFSFNN